MKSRLGFHFRSFACTVLVVRDALLRSRLRLVVPRFNYMIQNVATSVL